MSHAGLGVVGVIGTGGAPTGLRLVGFDEVGFNDVGQPLVGLADVGVVVGRPDGLELGSTLGRVVGSSGVLGLIGLGRLDGLELGNELGLTEG